MYGIALFLYCDVLAKFTKYGSLFLTFSWFATLGFGGKKHEFWLCLRLFKLKSKHLFDRRVESFSKPVISQAASNETYD